MSIAVGVWAAVVLLAISLCRMAKLGDDEMQAASAKAQAPARDERITRPPSSERPLRTLDLEDAASLLGVSPDTLLAWEARFGFPSSSPSEPRYSQSEVLALRDSLGDGLSIPSAVTHAREKIKRRRAPHAAGFVNRRDGGLAS